MAIYKFVLDRVHKYPRVPKVSVFSTLKGSIEFEKMAQWVSVPAMEALGLDLNRQAPPYKPDVAVDACNNSMILLSLGLQLLG